MKAAQIHEYGEPSVIKIEDIPTPSPAANQVLIEVHAASLNPFDSKVRSGAMKEIIPLNLPVTLGGDIAGVVTGIGEGVDDIAVGDRVYGQASAVAGNSGAFAEYAVTSADQISNAPENIDLVQIAAMPLVGSSALQALNQHIQLKAGNKLFINGGAGGIGSIAIQVAKHIGAYVATTATGEGLEYVKQLGADEAIDYKSQDFRQILEGYDAVFDTVGGDLFNQTFSILKQGGVAVSMAAQPDEAKAKDLGITAIYQQTKVAPEVLKQLKQLIEQGIITPQVGMIFPLDQVGHAFEAWENGSIQGKIVIEVKP